MLRKKIEYKPKRTRQKKIVFGSELEDSIYNIVRIHNFNYSNKKTELDIARRVVKRGLDVGDSETALFRLRNFLSKKAGKEIPRYTDDDDLLRK